VRAPARALVQAPVQQVRAPVLVQELGLQAVQWVMALWM